MSLRQRVESCVGSGGLVRGPRAAEPALDVVGVQPHHQALPDESAGRAVQGAAHVEDGVFAHPGRLLPVLGRASRRQRGQCDAPDHQTYSHACIQSRDDRLDQRLVQTTLVEAAQAAQAQRLVKRRLERIVARLDRAVLLRLARVAATRAACRSACTARRSGCVRSCSSARLMKAADRLSVRCSSGDASQAP